VEVHNPENPKLWNGDRIVVLKAMAFHRHAPPGSARLLLTGQMAGGVPLFARFGSTGQRHPRLKS
jgi:hypothetical protein